MKVICIILFFLVSVSISAQQDVSVFVGKNYVFANYYNISSDNQDIKSHLEYDLAFTTDEGMAGIHINEGAARNPNGDPEVIQLFEAPTNIFSDVISLPISTDSIYNIESTWEFGALNNQRDENDPLDYGWGLKDSGTNNIIGNKLYCLQLRNFTWKKFQILSLIDGVYTLKYADLDGSNEQTVLIDTKGYPTGALARFSFSSSEVIELEPYWDLLFTRYFDVQDASGTLVQQTVTSVLTAPYVTVAQADDIDVSTVAQDDYISELDDDITTIGWDWKFFNLGSFSYSLIPNRAYFIKLANDDIWKIHFIGFGGAKIGTIDFIKTYLGNLTTTNNIDDTQSRYFVFPNPSNSDQLNIAYHNNDAKAISQLSIYDMTGQLIMIKKLSKEYGLHVYDLNTSSYEKGQYIINMNFGDEVITQKYIKL